jgi:hypothetical protein
MLRWSIVLICVALAAGCSGASFANVTATAKLGTALGADPVVVGDWLADCEAIHATKDDPSLETICLSHKADYAGMVTTVRDVSSLLQAYATELAAAADTKDLTVGDDLTALIKQVGTLDVDKVKTSLPSVYNLATVLAKDSTLVDQLTPSGVVKIVDTITDFLSKRYRGAAIDKAVVAADPHIKVLTAFLSAEVELHLQDVVQVRKLLDDEVPTRPLTEATPAVAQLVPLVAAMLDARIASLKELDAACQAFATAHHTLAEAIRAGKPWKNGELLTQIKTDVQTIVKAING